MRGWTVSASTHVVAKGNSQAVADGTVADAHRIPTRYATLLTRHRRRRSGAGCSHLAARSRGRLSPAGGDQPQEKAEIAFVRSSNCTVGSAKGRRSSDLPHFTTGRSPSGHATKPIGGRRGGVLCGQAAVLRHGCLCPVGRSRLGSSRARTRIRRSPGLLVDVMTPRTRVPGTGSRRQRLAIVAATVVISARA